LVTDDNADWATDLWQKARGRGIKRPIPARVAKSTLDHACPSGAVHQGVAAIADPLPEASFDDWLRALEPNQGAVVVMLDQVTDPHNFGAILRSACAFGALGVVVQRRHTPDINALIAKTACGGVDLCPVAYETNLARTLDAAGKGGFITLGLDERGEPLPAILATLPATAPRRIMIVLGAEGPGLRRLIREGCDHLVALPTMPELPSLNVSNAAAVALYAVTTGTPAQKPL
jgi:23S rRNA (guanosine2251-2'-O)-methyltransferase